MTGLLALAKSVIKLRGKILFCAIYGVCELKGIV